MPNFGVNTWVFTSPLTDATAPAVLGRIAELGFDVVELPLENIGDLSAPVLRKVLQDTGLRPAVVGAMAPGRNLLAAPADEIAATQRYLTACLDLAADIGASAVCGPFYTATGRVWRSTPDERRAHYQQWQEGLAPVVEHAKAVGVQIGIEPLNRYETSLINTTEQALEALAPLLGPHLGLALDSYHLGIEERSTADAVRRVGAHLVHLQVCGSDRGTPGGDQTDWIGLRDALADIGYHGPWVIESFTADNAAIAVAASIWRPLAASQEALAADGLRFLQDLTTGSNQ